MATPRDARLEIVHPEIRSYLAGLAAESDPLVAAMEAEAAASGFPIVGRQTGRWLEQLTRMVGGKRVFEFGSGYGYSALFFARAVGPGGEVHGSDTNPKWIDVHRTLWAGHALADRVHLTVGWGKDALAALPGEFDVFLIDSTKVQYGDDLDLALSRCRAGGLVLVDNVLWGGRVTVDGGHDETTAAIHAFNLKVFAKHDVNVLPVGDGLAVIRKP